MASGSNILVALVAIGGAYYAYTQGWLCKLNIPQLCPSGGGGGGGAANYLNPQTNLGFPDDKLSPGIQHAIGVYPAGGRLHQYPRTGGYGDEGYGDDYGYESNAAHISIA